MAVKGKRVAVASARAGAGKAMCERCASRAVCKYYDVVKAPSLPSGSVKVLVSVECNHFIDEASLGLKVVVCPACLKEFEDVEGFLHHAHSDPEHIVEFASKYAHAARGEVE